MQVTSAVSGFSFEGYEVVLYNGNPPTAGVFNEEGIAYIEYQSLEGEDHLVEFQTKQKNFNPQGVGATEWSDVWDQQKLSERVVSGQNSSVELLVIPSTRIDVDFINDSPMVGDSIFINLHHQLFKNEIVISGQRTAYNLNYSAPIGQYTYEGMIYTLNDSTPISGSFMVPHSDSFSKEIRF